MIVRLSIHLALVGWLFGPLAACLGRDHLAWQKIARIAWTLGWIAYVIHVAAAFETVHDWSHAAAWEETLRQTEELTGTASGAGLWLNYLFTAWWTIDVFWWWTAGLSGYRMRSAKIDAALHGFFLFMVFNATVVFEEGWIRVGGAVATLLVAGAAISAALGRRSTQGAAE